MVLNPKLEVYEAARRTWGDKVIVAVVTGCDDEMLDQAEQMASKDLYMLVYQKPLKVELLEMIYRNAEDSMASQ